MYTAFPTERGAADGGRMELNRYTKRIASNPGLGGHTLVSSDPMPPIYDRSASGTATFPRAS